MVGDAIEFHATQRSFGGLERPKPLVIGSVKSNIGHLEATSGLAGLIKAVLMLEKAIIPPNPNFKNPKPNLNYGYGNQRVCMCSISRTSKLLKATI